MNRPLHFRRPQSVRRSARRRNIFHDVHLAARGPPRPRTHHPERRPQSRPHRQLHASFHSPVLKFSQPHALHPRRSPRPSRSRLCAHSQRPNNQMSLPILKCIRLFSVAHRWHSGVLRTSGHSGRAINFQFMIAPTIPAHLIRPVARIRRRAAHAGIKFIAPNGLAPLLPVSLVSNRRYCQCGNQSHTRVSHCASRDAFQNIFPCGLFPNPEFILHYKFLTPLFRAVSPQLRLHIINFFLPISTVLSLYFRPVATSSLQS